MVRHGVPTTMGRMRSPRLFGCVEVERGLSCVGLEGAPAPAQLPSVARAPGPCSCRKMVSPGAASKCCLCARALQLQETGQPRRNFQVLPVRQGPAAAGNWSTSASIMLTRAQCSVLTGPWPQGMQSAASLRQGTGGFAQERGKEAWWCVMPRRRPGTSVGPAALT